MNLVDESSYWDKALHFWKDKSTLGDELFYLITLILSCWVKQIRTQPKNTQIQTFCKQSDLQGYVRKIYSEMMNSSDAHKQLKKLKIDGSLLYRRNVGQMVRRKPPYLHQGIKIMIDVIVIATFVYKLYAAKILKRVSCKRVRFKFNLLVKVSSLNVPRYMMINIFTFFWVMRHKVLFLRVFQQ